MMFSVVALASFFSFASGEFPNILVQQNDGSSFFARVWSEYKAGFGDTSGNYWIGNDKLNTLTQGNKYKLRFDLQSLSSGLWYWAEYDTFSVGDESTQYTLTIGGFSGNVWWDAIAGGHNLNGMKFSTSDRENDLWTSSCVTNAGGGGFWYRACSRAYVNSAGYLFYWNYINPNYDAKLRTCRMWLVDVDECATGNGGCDTTCTNTQGSFTCSCNAGYTLNADARTCGDINECETDNGGCQMKCVNTDGSFRCECDLGYTLNNDGSTCSDIDECETDNGGCQMKCVNTDGSFRCECDPGYALNSDGKTCSDINECETDNGGCQMKCVNTDGSFRCECDPGYTLNNDGSTCSDIDECQTDKGGCQMICVNTDGSFRCECDLGYALNSDGSTCSDVDECATGNGGCEMTCTNTVGSFTCSCHPGYRLADDARTCSGPGNKDHDWHGTRLPPGLVKQEKV